MLLSLLPSGRISDWITRSVSLLCHYKWSFCLKGTAKKIFDTHLSCNPCHTSLLRKIPWRTLWFRHFQECQFFWSSCWPIYSDRTLLSLLTGDCNDVIMDPLLLFSLFYFSAVSDVSHGIWSFFGFRYSEFICSGANKEERTVPLV